MSKNEIIFDLATVIISAIIGAIVALGIVQLIRPYLLRTRKQSTNDDYRRLLNLLSTILPRERIRICLNIP
jgi:phosphate/sulfate permease